MGGEESPDGCNLERGKGWIEEGGTEGQGPKLEMVGSLMEQECEGHGMMVKCKRRRRRRLVKLIMRGGTAELGGETGGWRSVRREERICKTCRGGEVEDIGHLVMRFTYYVLEELMN